MWERSRAVSLGSLARSQLASSFQLPELQVFPARTYSVDDHCAKHSCGDLFAVLGILSRAHDGMVAGGEHGAEGAEDYDGEDGDDDAGWWKCQCTFLASPALAYIPSILLFLPRCLRRTMSMR